MDTLNPDLFSSLPCWLPRTQAAADWLHELDGVDPQTCSLEALRRLALSAPSIQSSLWLLRIYFSRLAKDKEAEEFQEFLHMFEGIEYDNEEAPSSLRIEFIVAGAPDLKAGQLIDSCINSSSRAAAAEVNKSAGLEM